MSVKTITIGTTLKSADGKTTKKNYQYANPNVDDRDIAYAMRTLNALSTDTIKAIQRVTTNDVAFDDSTPDSEFLHRKEITAAGSASVDAFNAVINGSSSIDNITVSGSYSTISTGDGNDTVKNTGYRNSIDAGAGNDQIFNEADNVVIYAGAGNDTIYNTGSNVTIYPGASNDTIHNSGHNVVYVIEKGNTANKILGFNLGEDTVAFDDSVLPDSSNVSLSFGHDQVSVSGPSKSGMAVLYDPEAAYNFGDKIRVSITTGETSEIEVIRVAGSSKADYYENHTPNISIESGTGNDTIINTADNVSIRTGGAGDDSIVNSGRNVIINATAGLDTIINTGDNASLNSGVGHDTIVNSGADVTIFANFGNDVIVNNGKRTTYLFAKSEGYNTIMGFDAASDTIVLQDVAELPAPNQVSISADFKQISIPGNSSRVAIVDEENGYTFDTPINVSIESGSGTVRANCITLTDNADTYDMTLANRALALGNGKDSVTVSADYVTLSGVSGTKKIDVAGNYCSIYSGTNASAVSIVGEAHDNTLFGGKTNKIYYSNGKGNYFRLEDEIFRGSYDVTIHGYDEKADTFIVNQTPTIKHVVVADTKTRVSLRGTSLTIVYFPDQTSGKFKYQVDDDPDTYYYEW